MPTILVHSLPRLLRSMLLGFVPHVFLHLPSPATTLGILNYVKRHAWVLVEEKCRVLFLSAVDLDPRVAIEPRLTLALAIEPRLRLSLC